MNIMKGVIVSNGFMSSEKFSQPVDMLCRAADDMGIRMKRISNDMLAVPIGDGDALTDVVGDADFVIFWDKDVRAATNLELCGHRLFNPSECIRICDDKSLTHLALCRNSIPSIETISLPIAFNGYTDLGFADRLSSRFGYPMVVKDCFGSFGEQVRKVEDRESLIGLLSGPYIPRIAQRYVETGAEDIRVEVVGEDVVASVLRHGPPGDFRSNCTIGGRMENHELSEECAELAIRASEAVGADFCGVDILFDDGRPLVCEVNSNAHIRNLADCTGHDVSYDILRHIAESLR